MVNRIFGNFYGFKATPYSFSACLRTFLLMPSTTRHGVARSKLCWNLALLTKRLTLWILALASKQPNYRIYLSGFIRDRAIAMRRGRDWDFTCLVKLWKRITVQFGQKIAIPRVPCLPSACRPSQSMSPRLSKMPSSPLKILLVEDDELFRLGLRVRLQQEAGFEIVAEAEDGEIAIEMAQRHPLDIVVLDIGLPGIGGIEACRQIRQQCANLPILILTSHTQKSLITRIIEAGAQGYCLKGAPSETLVLAIRSVAAGASWWDSAATNEIRAAFETNTAAMSGRSLDKADSALTRREQEILR